MNATLARAFTRMHSQEWRRHYGAEFEALLLDLNASPRVVLDVSISICSSRQYEVNIAAAAVTIALLASMFAPYHGASGATVATHKGSLIRVSATNPPCHTYSSVVRSEFIQQHRCLG